MYHAPPINHLPRSRKSILDHPWVMEGADAKIRSLIASRGWVPSTSSLNMVATERGTPARTLQKEYEQRWRHFRKFACLVDDYGSAIICSRSYCPDRPDPVRPDTLMAYLAFMSRERNQLVFRPGQEEDPVRDRNGNAVYGCAQWRSPNTIGKCVAAFKALHNLYGHLHHQIPFLSTCPDCIFLNTDITDGIHRSCVTCNTAFGRPRLTNVGNVANHVGLRAFRSLITNQLNASHEIKGNIQLLPGEVRELRKHLLDGAGDSSTFVSHLKFYTMILVGISLFLRSDELLKLKFDDIIREYCLVCPNRGVVGIAIKVQGKSDKKPVNLMLWKADEYPELCPVRHLLVYLYVTRFKSGYLFPKQESYSEGEVTTLYEYNVFLTKLKKCSEDYLQRTDTHCCYGTHVLRKTAYQFAIWGLNKANKPEFDNHGGHLLPQLSSGIILKGARHRTVGNALTYMRGSNTNYYAMVGMGLREHDVNIFKDINITRDEGFRILISNSHRLQFPLPELANWYVCTYLNVELNPNHLFRSQKHVLRVAYSKTVIDDGSRWNDGLAETMVRLIKRPEDIDEAMLVIERLRRSWESSTGPHNTPESLCNVITTGEPQPVARTTPTTLPTSIPLPAQATNGKKRIYGDDDLEVRKVGTWSPLSNEERLDALLFANSRDFSSLTNSARGFVSNWAKPVAICLKECHRDSKTAFLNANKIIRRYCGSGSRYLCETCDNTKMPGTAPRPTTAPGTI